MTDISAELKERLMNIFEHLHANPEISWQEFGTRDFLEPILKEAGCRVTRYDDCPGLVADWGEGDPQVGLRGDMDALWQKVDGHFCANHTCGHDAHMTMALGVLLHLQEQGYQRPVRLVFQPAEEKAEGALKMVELGAVDGLSHFFGVHVRPIQELRSGQCGPAILHGSCASLEGQIIGDDAHAGRPHLAPNAIEVGADLVKALQGIHLDPMVPYSVKLTRLIAGGSATNIIPGQADFAIDFRAQTNEQMQQLVARTESTIQTIANHHGVEIRFHTHLGTPASEVSDEARDFMAAGIKAALGADAYHPPVVTGGGDDFHYYTIKRPDLKASMLALGCDLSPGLHHPKMTFDREAIFHGIRAMSEAVKITQAHLDA